MKALVRINGYEESGDRIRQENGHTGTGIAYDAGEDGVTERIGLCRSTRRGEEKQE